MIGMLHTDLTVGRFFDADKGRDLRLSGGYHCGPYREQVGALHHPEPQNAPWRFNELKKNLEGISQKSLTDSLCSLEEDGVVVRMVYPGVLPRVEYALSELGESMRPILDAMEAFGLNYQALVRAGE